LAGRNCHNLSLVKPKEGFYSKCLIRFHKRMLKILEVVPGAGFSLILASSPRPLVVGACPYQTPDYESGALARLGYPGKLPLFLLAEII
jgi:hypothetical protein